MTTSKAVFYHKNYSLVADDRIVRNAGAPKPTAEEDAEVLAELARYVETKIISDYGFTSIQIPEDENPSTSILASNGWMIASKLLIIIQNAYGSQLGIYSRSICFDQGISKGTWLPYIERAVAAGYSVLILRPNTNSVVVENAGESPIKVPIKGSESPEIHVLNVWENVVNRNEKANHIVLLSYGNGASLCKDLFLREMVSTQSPENNRIKGFITIEASHIIEKDDASDIRDALGRIAVNMEGNPATMGNRLGYRKDQLGCTCISLGLPPGVTEVKNVAASVYLGMDAIFKYLTIAESGGNVAKNFGVVIARDNGLDYTTAIILINPNAQEDDNNGSGLPPPPSPASSTKTPPPSSQPEKPGFFSRLFGGGSGKTNTPSNKDKNGDEKLTVADFDLLKIVGKGAFGKVMLVRKKNSADEGKVYAMKVLRKDVIAAKGQIEHTKSERDILFEVRHPYIVRLRYAFQSDDKLYLVTDYYNGGTLFYHLRKSRHFTEERAKFYAAQLLSALDHLHKLNIIYRDLKLENVLMDHQGHLALTDFGLSKQNIDVTGGATTFCGTAEYIAPELLKGQKYGAAVDWWSFGILL
jgi:tRNA A-37 threonylcarbamoyl transferase component Bud32